MCMLCGRARTLCYCSGVLIFLLSSQIKSSGSRVETNLRHTHKQRLKLPSSLLSQVGKGYGSHDSTKLISTRILQDYGDWVVFDSIIEASAVQANPFVLRYLHDFRFAFKDGGFVYFLFSRTLGVQDNKNFTFISRMCEDDQGYYSYTELQLNCSATNKYNKAQVMITHSSASRLAVSIFIKMAAATRKNTFEHFTSG